MKSWHMLIIRGKLHEWYTDMYLDETTAAEMRQDGLKLMQIGTEVHAAPDWWRRLGIPLTWWLAVEPVVLMFKVR